MRLLLLCLSTGFAFELSTIASRRSFLAAMPVAAISLPAFATDAAGLANLRPTQRHAHAFPRSCATAMPRCTRAPPSDADRADLPCTCSNGNQYIAGRSSAFGSTGKASVDSDEINAVGRQAAVDASGAAAAVGVGARGDSITGGLKTAVNRIPGEGDSVRRQRSSRFAHL